MTQPTIRFRALVTRAQLTEMMTPTYAKLKNIDPNEAYGRLETALRELELIEGLQAHTYEAVLAQKPDLSAADVVELIANKLRKPRRFKIAPMKPIDEGPWLALSFLMDRGAGVASGESLDLLRTDQGQKILQKGFALAGAHLAKELLR